jgi:hypothetical protein
MYLKIRSTAAELCENHKFLTSVINETTKIDAKTYHHHKFYRNGGPRMSKLNLTTVSEKLHVYNNSLPWATKETRNPL